MKKNVRRRRREKCGGRGQRGGVGGWLRRKRGRRRL